MGRIFVGLSGGVDSATSAALLKEQGHDVTGVFIKIWQPEFTECMWKEDRLDAMRVATHLGIPFREIDLSDDYMKEVVSSMIDDYRRGITPNPDVLCNCRIKFGSFMRWARAEGADAIATGHYARISKNAQRYSLLRGIDPDKDQSYFLYRLGQDDLAHTLFPVGELPKPQVRQEAKRFSLPVAEKKDSQGLCFVGDVSIPEFLSRFIPLQKGRVFDQAGRVIGEHDGAALYTIGQRHGFVARSREPLYVTGVDVIANSITVSARREDASRSMVALIDAHWIGEAPSFPFDLTVQARYRERPVPANLRKEGNRLIASFSEPHLCSPGQSLVFYKDHVCLGGAIIS